MEIQENHTSYWVEYLAHGEWSALLAVVININSSLLFENTLYLGVQVLETSTHGGLNNKGSLSVPPTEVIGGIIKFRKSLHQWLSTGTKAHYLSFLLPGNPLQYPGLENPHGQRSLAGCSPWGRKLSDMTKWPGIHTLCGLLSTLKLVTPLNQRVPGDHSHPVRGGTSLRSSLERTIEFLPPKLPATASWITQTWTGFRALNQWF